MKILTFCIGFLAAFSACGVASGSSRIKNFDYELQGTWVSNEASAIYQGTLIIGNDRITINGYGEEQTLHPLEGGDDNKRPFKNFTKGTPLKGYSEEKNIFIEDGGMVQESIPYIYWDDSPPPDYKKVKFLRFTFGGRIETLQYQ